MVRRRSLVVPALACLSLVVGVAQAQAKDTGTDACTAIKDEVACGASAEGVLHPLSCCQVAP